LLHSVLIYEIHRKWADRLAEWGYVALLVNSKDRRGTADKSQPREAATTRAHDAYGALAYLR
jgi:dienelactone hydrolase